MDRLFDINWSEVFSPSVGLGEIVLRGTLIYLALFLFLRFLLKREAGVIGIADLLVVVLIADAAQNAMTSEYKSITEGLVLVGTIIFWNYMIDWLGFRFPRFQRFIYPPPLPLIKDGQIQRRNMRQEMITEEELMSQLRQQGVDDVSEVKHACMEGDGRISVVAKKRTESGGQQSDKKLRV